MTMKEELIKLCRYYKGEKECPYKMNEQQTQLMFWEYEEGFCRRFENGEFNQNEPEESFKEYMCNLLKRLADKYECMDNGEHFLRLYIDSKA